MRRSWALPLVPLYAAGSALRWVGSKPQKLAWPVVSVGSLSAGGAGKTPLVIALAKLMTERGWAVDVLSRGYGRADGKVGRVDLGGSAEVFGDEPLLIAREAGVPVFVGARRFDAGRVAEAEGGSGVHLLDDGFQHRQLFRQVDVVLVNSKDMEDSLLPAGNRREPLSALRRASVFAVEEGDDAVVRRLQGMGLGPDFGQPVWLYRRAMVAPQTAGPVVAFCGIARPGQFFAGLEGLGVKVAARRIFPDHHRFTDAELEALGKMALKGGAAAFITTGKDAVRLGSRAARLGLPVVVADLQMQFLKEDGVTGWLQARLD